MFSKVSRHTLSLSIRRSRGDWFIAAAWCFIILAGTCRANDAAAVAGAEDSQTAPTELSVAPLDFPFYPEDRPDWIDQPPQLDGAVHQWPVVSVPSLNRERCRESLREQTRIAISAYATHLFARGRLETFDSLDDDSSRLFEQEASGRTRSPIKIKESWVRAFLDDAERSYFGTVGTSDGEMFEEAALLHFDGALRATLQKEWRSQQVGQRLTRLGVLASGSMVLLISLSSVLRRAAFRK